MTDERRKAKYEAIAETVKYTNNKNDKKYIEYIKNGNMQDAKRMVGETAKYYGYKYKAYHHTENYFTVFDINKARRSMDIQGFYFSADPDAEREYGSARYDTYLKMDNPDIIDSGEKANAIPVMFGVEDYGVKVREWLQENGYDSVIRKAEYYGAEADEYIVFESEQIKSADLVTYDDDGNIIPLSERFKDDRTGSDAWKNKDIRFQAKKGTKKSHQ